MANIAAALLILLLAAPAVYAVQYNVGDNSGWTSGFDYTTWVSGKTFTVGDVLVFTYSSTHKVDVVPKSSYDNCVSSNALQSYSDGNTKITLNETGTTYFICPTAGHCAGGMKLAVTVSAGTTPTTPSGSPSPPSSGTPSARTPPSTTSPPPRSAAASIFCNVYNMVAVIICLFVLAFMG